MTHQIIPDRSILLGQTIEWRDDLGALRAGRVVSVPALRPGDVEVVSPRRIGPPQRFVVRPDQVVW